MTVAWDNACVQQQFSHKWRCSLSQHCSTFICKLAVTNLWVDPSMRTLSTDMSLRIFYTPIYDSRFHLISSFSA